MKIRLDSKGIEQVLKSAEVRQAVDDAASAVHSAVVAAVPPGTDVVQDSYTTDRAAASVTVRDVRGRIWQARDGLMTRAAASVGLEVTER